METPVLKFLFYKALGLQVYNFIKKRLQASAFLDYCEIFKNAYFEEHRRTAASLCSNYLLRYKNFVIQNMFPGRF